MLKASPSILVTGASGFVGRRVVEELLAQNFVVRALVRRSPQQGFDASVRVVLGDLRKPETYRAALDGVAAVVHAALTDDLSKEPEATSKLLELARNAKVQTFVHLSSVAVYGNYRGGTVTEETALIPSSDQYSRTKLAIENAMRTDTGRTKIVILRLACVYGAGGGWWTTGLLNQMQRGKLILVNHGTGTANLIHVSDVAKIVGIVLKSANPPFEIFNVTDGNPVPWSRYFAELEKIAGHTATVPMTEAAAREHGKKWTHPSLVRRVIRKLSRAPVIFPLDDRGIENYASCTIYCNRKAASVLRFAPAFDLKQGLRTR